MYMIVKCQMVVYCYTQDFDRTAQPVNDDTDALACWDADQG